MPLPKSISDFLANFAINGLKGAVGGHLQENGDPCGLKDCESFSIGLTCHECHRSLCHDHVYFKPSLKAMKPIPICPSCIADNHPEIF